MIYTEIISVVQMVPHILILLIKIYHYMKNYFLIIQIKVIYSLIPDLVMKALIKGEVIVIFLKEINQLKLEKKLSTMILIMI